MLSKLSKRTATQSSCVEKAEIFGKMFNLQKTCYAFHPFCIIFLPLLVLNLFFDWTMISAPYQVSPSYEVISHSMLFLETFPYAIFILFFILLQIQQYFRIIPGVLLSWITDCMRWYQSISVMFLQPLIIYSYLLFYHWNVQGSKPPIELDPGSPVTPRIYLEIPSSSNVNSEIHHRFPPPSIGRGSLQQKLDHFDSSNKRKWRQVDCFI